MSDAIAELIRSGRLESVPVDTLRARAILDEAHRHLVSARRISRDDAHGAYQLLYDAARKAVWAHMLAHGYRPTNAPGAHAAAAIYASSVLDAREFDRMRRSRNRSEYGTTHLGKRVLETDLEHAAAIVARVEEEFAS